MQVGMFQPVNIESVIAVAATDPEDKKTSFSNYGTKIDVSAPGGGSGNMQSNPSGGHYYVNILSLRARDTDMYLASGAPNYTPGEFVLGERYYRARGTSMACPHVAGLAALIISMYPQDSPEEIRARIMAGADDIDTLNPKHEGLLGAGRINAYTSMTIRPGPFLKIVDIDTDNIFPGESGNMVVYLKNFWEDVTGLEATLSADDPRVLITQGDAVFGDIPLGQTRTNANDPYSFSLPSDMVLGENIEFDLIVRSNGGYEETIGFVVRVSSFQNIGAGTGLPLTVGTLMRHTEMADYNNDGFGDILYVDLHYGWSNVWLYENNRDGTFTLANEEAGVDIGGPRTHPYPTATFVDLDNDGSLDLFAGGTNGTSSLLLNGGDGTFTDIGESAGVSSVTCEAVLPFDYDNDGFVDLLGGDDRDHFFLLRNERGVTFENVINSTGMIRDAGLYLSQLVSFDFDNDNDVDIFISSLETVMGPAALYRNNGDNTFADVTLVSGTSAPGVFQGDAATVGDYDNDGDLDVFLSDVSTTQGNILFRNNGDGTFTDVLEDMWGLSRAITGSIWGTAFFDYDNDGDLDLYIVGDSSPAHELYRNNGDGTFTNVSKIVFPRDIDPSWGMACIGDYDNDGDQDIYVVGSMGGKGAFLDNVVGNRNNWIRIQLEGTRSNRGAIGARVIVEAGKLRQIREVRTSPVQMQPLHFGLGEHELVEDIEILWPSGVVQRLLDTEVNQLILVIEPEIETPRILSVVPNVASVNGRVVMRGESFGEYNPSDGVFSLRADVNGDGVVGDDDLSLVLASWGTTGQRRIADVDKDGLIDYRDLIEVGLAFGTRQGDPDYEEEADLTNDGIIDDDDLPIVLAWFELPAFDPSYNEDADVDRDGVIDDGDLLTVQSFWGAIRPGTYVEFNGVMARVLSWSDTEIACEVPGDAATGNVYVVNGVGRSNGVHFTMEAPSE